MESAHTQTLGKNHNSETIRGILGSGLEGVRVFLRDIDTYDKQTFECTSDKALGIETRKKNYYLVYKPLLIQAAKILSIVEIPSK